MRKHAKPSSSKITTITETGAATQLQALPSDARPRWLQFLFSHTTLSGVSTFVALGVMVYSAAMQHENTVTQMVILIPIVLGIQGVRRGAETINASRVEATANRQGASG